jgi:guanine deaminase
MSPLERAASQGAARDGDLIIQRARVLSGGEQWSEERDIVIEAGTITAVEPARIRPASRTVPTLDASGQLAIPGLVNSHTHTSNNLLRATGDDLWLETHLINSADGAMHWGVDDYYTSAAFGAIEMIRTGTTSALDMVKATGDRWREKIEAVFRAYNDIGFDVTIAPTLADVPYTRSLGPFAEDVPADIREQLDRISLPMGADEQIERLEDLARAKSRPAAGETARLGVGPVNPTQCTDHLLEACAALASRYGLLIQTHCLESKLEALTSVGAAGDTMVDRLVQLDFLRENVSLAHAVWLTDRDARSVAHAGATVVHNPMSNLKLGSGVAPVRTYLDLGVRVALGTDGVANSDNNNMFQSMWLATILSHASNADPSRWLSAREGVTLATTSTDSQRPVGTLAPGARADIVLLDGASTFLTPRAGKDPYVLLAYSQPGSSVRSSIIGGRIVMRDGRIVTIDEDAILRSANDVWERFRANRTGVMLKTVGPHLLAIQKRIARMRYLVERHTAPSY